ncbi:major capsid protein, partial [Xanthomonas campestris]|uniref:major capsid protein n=1 Tax=Xanthomonas campestris TaxID=339 RepID=UPI003D6EA735
AGAGRSSVISHLNRNATMDFDVSGAATAFGGVVAAVALIGGAKILPNAAIKAWGWITSAIRG